MFLLYLFENLEIHIIFKLILFIFSKIKMSDENNDGELDEKEFQNFMQKIYARKELFALFKL